MQWQKLNWEDVNMHICKDDQCYYWDYFLSKQASPGEDIKESSKKLTSHIYNFNKPPNRKGKVEWEHRDTTILFFVEILSKIIEDDPTTGIISVPSSKTTDDSDYDNRFEDMFHEFSKARPLVKVISPITIRGNVTPSHAGGTREPEEIIANYQLTKPHELLQLDKLIICDDVITTGGHFRAMSNFITGEGNFKKPIIGLFFGKTYYNNKPHIAFNNNPI